MLWDSSEGEWNGDDDPLSCSRLTPKLSKLVRRRGALIMGGSGVATWRIGLGGGGGAYIDARRS